MKRLLFLGLTLVATASVAHIAPPHPVTPVANPTMVIDDRGSLLEVLATQRAVPQVSAPGRQVVHAVAPASPMAPIGPRELGVVFNHAKQVQGYITGEIAFKMKDGVPPAGFDAASYPGFAKRAGPDVYLVVAGTPGEYVRLVKRLQTRSDLEWVEPVVIYGPSQAA